MSIPKLSTFCLVPLLYLVSCTPMDLPEKGDHPSIVAETEPMPISIQDDHDNNLDEEEWNKLAALLQKRGWNNLSGAWGKKSNWNNLSNMWGKRNNWNNLSNMWGKKSNWNNLSGAWGKRGWNNLSGAWGKRGWNNLQGAWGKRGWNNLSGAWGKRPNWNNLNGLWGKRVLDATALADEGNKRTKWNNLKGMWGKRGDKDLMLEELYQQGVSFDDEPEDPIVQDHL